MKEKPTPDNDRKESETVKQHEKGPEMAVDMMKEKSSPDNDCEEYKEVRKKSPKMMTVAPPEIVYSNRFLPLQEKLEQELPEPGQPSCQKG